MDSQNTENNTSANTDSKVTVTNGKLFAIIAYIGPLVIISYLLGKDDSFVKFHTKQGLLLFAAEAAMWLMGLMIWMLFPIIQIVNLAILILAIIGIVNAAQNKEKELPFIGHFANTFNI